MLRTIALPGSFLALVWCCAACACAAQWGVPQLGVPKSKTVIKTETKLVQVAVAVFDDKGAAAPELKKSNFRIFDDGVEQEVRYFSHERVPVSLVLVVDDSESVTHKLPFIRNASATILAPYPDRQSQSRSGDEFAIIRFAQKPSLVLDFSGEAWQQVKLEGDDSVFPPTKGKEGGTSLFDTVYLAVTYAHLNAFNKQHAAVILITDGGDTHSRYNIKEVKGLLEESDVPVFSILPPPVKIRESLFDPLDRKHPRIEDGSSHRRDPFSIETDADIIGPAERRGPSDLKQLAEASGGGVFTASKDEDIPHIAYALCKAIRFVYLVGYVPKGLGGVKRPPHWDGAHKVKVLLTPENNFHGYATYFKRAYRESPAALVANTNPPPALAHP
jgi:Ca-activated chloride channel family protein